MEEKKLMSASASADFSTTDRKKLSIFPFNEKVVKLKSANESMVTVEREKVGALTGRSSLENNSERIRTAYNKEKVASMLVKLDKLFNGKAVPFPIKLMKIIDSSVYEEIVTWLPHGKAFMITDTDDFVKYVLSVHYKEAKFSSFQRKLYRWGFAKEDKGSSGRFDFIYFHKFFQKGNVNLCLQMHCSYASKVKGESADMVNVFPPHVHFDLSRDRGERSNQNFGGRNEWISERYNSTFPRNSTSSHQTLSPRIALQMSLNRSQENNRLTSFSSHQYPTNLPFPGNCDYTSPLRQRGSEDLLKKLLHLRKCIEREDSCSPSNRSGKRLQHSMNTSASHSSSSSGLNNHTTTPDSCSFSGVKKIRTALLPEQQEFIFDQWPSFQFRRTGLHQSSLNEQYSSPSDEFSEQRIPAENSLSHVSMAEILHPERTIANEPFQARLSEYIADRRKTHCRIIQNAWDALKK